MRLNNTEAPLDGFAIEPSDTEDLARVARGIWVGSGGVVNLVTYAGTTLTFPIAGNGGYIWLAVRRVLATDTTATNMSGFV